MKEKKLSLLTVEGCRRLLAVCICVILLFSLIGGLISSSGGRVNMSRLSFDVRGGVMTAELYTPQGVNADSKLPAIMVCAGGGCTATATSGLSQELARRGFVVMNLNVYGAGPSENPATDDMGLPPGVFYAARGAIDAFEYLRTLKYVDQTRLGLLGHSMGGLRTGAAATAHASFFTLNDLLINELTEVFGVELTYEEISQDATELAEKYLNEDQLVYFNELKAKDEKFFNEGVKAWFALGSGASVKAKNVTVGGYEVFREPQVNIGFSFGLYDGTTRTKTFVFPEDAKDTVDGVSRSLMGVFQTGETPVEPSTWYEVMQGCAADEQPQSKVIGDASSLAYGSSDELTQAIDNRSARVYFFTSESHSRNFFSSASARNVVHFFTDALSYNGGEIGAEGAKPIPYSNVVFMWRNVCNLIAMLAMILMMVTIAALLLKKPYFAACTKPCPEPALEKKSPVFWVVSLFAAAVGIWAIFYVGGKDLGFGHNIIKTSNFFPFSGSGTGGISWLFWVNLAFVVGIVGFALAKKVSIKDLVNSLGIKTPFGAVMKSLLIALICVSCGYLSLLIIRAVFFQTYHFWMSGFDFMAVPRICAWLRIFIISLPIFFLCNCSFNAGCMKDMDERKNILICIGLNILSLFIVAVINYGYMYITKQGMLTPFFITHFPLFLYIPITCLIARKLYKMTGSIWLGTFFNAAMISWSWASMGDNNVYYGASLLMKYLGL